MGSDGGSRRLRAAAVGQEEEVRDVLLDVPEDRANDLCLLLATMEEHKRRHGLHVVQGNKVSISLIYIDFQEGDMRVRLREGGDVGCDLDAGTTPRGIEVNDDVAGVTEMRT